MTDAVDRSDFQITERRCKVCASPVRAEVDARLLGDVRNVDDRLYTYDEIVEWAAGEGVSLTPSGLSRHRHSHLQPSVLMALETQRYMDAIAKATGRKLSLHSAVANVIATKTLRELDGLDASQLDPEKLLRVALRAAEVSLKIEKAEQQLSPEVAAKIDERLTAAGLEEDVLRRIRSEIYGLTT
mgnify:CR=1 FL=1